MNRGVFQGSLVQQMVGGSPSWWSMSNLRPNTGEPSPLLYPHPPFSSALPQPLQSPNSLSLNSLYESQELPQSWSQLLLGGLVGEEERYSLGIPFKKTLMNWEDQLMHQPEGAHAVDVKQENSDSSAACYAFSHESTTNEIQAASGARASWSHILPSISSPRSCVTSSLNSNILDFSNNKLERRHLHPDHASECNSIETALKKARVQGSSSSQSNTTFKVRKEKLGDRITALHQLASPFGKTDTASVLLEAIGYIRFLQNQIEALSSPYLTTGSGNMRQLVGERSCIFPEDPGQLLNDSCMKKMGRGDQDGNADQPKKDLRSRGLCLVPVSCTMHVGSEDGTDYWSPSISGGFR